MTAQEYWEQQKGTVMEEMAGAENNETLLACYCRFMEGMKTRVLSSMGGEEILRQQTVLLFLQAEHGAQLLLTRAEPTLRAENTQSFPKQVRRSFLSSQILLYAVLGTGSLLSLSSGLICLRTLPFFAAAGAILYFRSVQKKETTVNSCNWKAVSEIRKDALENCIERQVQYIDAYIMDLRRLLDEVCTPKPDIPLEMEAVRLCQSVWACAQQNYPVDNVMDATDKLLEKNGLEWVEFSEQSRRLFDVMPTRREARTIYPALRKKEDGTLVSKGMQLKST